MKAHVSEKKKKLVNEYAKELEKANIIGIIDKINDRVFYIR